MTKCVASDVFVQKVVEGGRSSTHGACSCFFTLGLTYVGAFQYGLYNRLMKPAGAALAKRAGVGASVGFLVAVDQFLVCPLLYLCLRFPGSRAGPGASAAFARRPARMAAESRARRSPRRERGGARRARRALRPRAADGAGDDGGWLTLVALWAYWVPAQAVNFWVVPRHLTIPFMNAWASVGTGIMSAMNGAKLGVPLPGASGARDGARHGGVSGGRAVRARAHARVRRRARHRRRRRRPGDRRRQFFLTALYAYATRR